MKIINEIEEDGRGPYGGAIGQFGFNGDCTFAIPINLFSSKGLKLMLKHVVEMYTTQTQIKNT